MHFITVRDFFSGNYKEQMQALEADIAILQAEVEKTKEGKSWLLSLVGKGDLAKAKKEITKKHYKKAYLESLIAKLNEDKAALKMQYCQKLKEARDGYKKEIDAAILRAEQAEKTIKQKESVIAKQQNKIEELDRKANPLRYTLSSGATLVNCFTPNRHSGTVHIWTQVGKEVYDISKYDIDYSLMQKYFNDEITQHEFVNEVFEACEQINEAQAKLLGTTLVALMGGPGQPQMSMSGGGGSYSQSPWGERDKDKVKYPKKGR